MKGADKMNVIKKLRINKNMTQLELAESLGVKRTTVSMWERGNNIPPTEKVKKLSELFGVTADSLIESFFKDNNIEKSI